MNSVYYYHPKQGYLQNYLLKYWTKEGSVDKLMKDGHILRFQVKW